MQSIITLRNDSATEVHDVEIWGQLYLICRSLKWRVTASCMNFGVSHLCGIFRVICVAHGGAEGGGHLRRVLGARGLVCSEAREGGHVTSAESRDPHWPLSIIHPLEYGAHQTSLPSHPKRGERTFSLCCTALWPRIKASSKRNPGYAIKFSGLSRESVSSRPSIHGWEKAEERPHADIRGEREKERGSVCVWQVKKIFSFHTSMCKQVPMQKSCKYPQLNAKMRENRVDNLCVCVWAELGINETLI